MLRTYLVLSFFNILLPCRYTMAVESGGQRGLQTGPAGDGAVFQNIGRTDLEANLGIGTLNGDVRTGENTQTISGRSTTLTLASGYGLNENLNFTIELNRKSTEISAETSNETSATPVVTSKLTHSQTQISAGPALWIGNTLLGAHASVTSWGKEKYKEGTSVVTIEPTQILRVKTFIGIRTGSITAAVR